MLETVEKTSYYLSNTIYPSKIIINPLSNYRDYLKVISGSLKKNVFDFYVDISFMNFYVF